MPTRDNNTLKYNHGEKSLKVPWVIYADFECLLIKQQLCQNNPKECYAEEKSIHGSCGYSIDWVSSFDSKQVKHSFYRGKDCAKKFSKDSKKHAIKIINFKEKEMKPLTDEEIIYYTMYAKKSFVTMKMKKINLNYIKKLKIIVIIQENLENLLIAFVI